MDPIVKELLISRIIAGVFRCRIDRRTYYVKSPTARQQYAASHIYALTYERCLKNTLFTDDELYRFLLNNGLWTDEEEVLLKKIPADIEDLKVSLYQSAFAENTRK